MGLVHPETGGRLQFDLYLPDYHAALEFQGPQHDGPTERYADPDAYRAQRYRDLLKLALSTELGIRLIHIKPEDLSFKRLRELLAPWVPLQSGMTAKWHLYRRLDRAAVQYRGKAARYAG